MVKSSSLPSNIGSTADPKQVTSLQQQRPQRERYIVAEEAGQRVATTNKMTSADKNSVHDKDACIFKLQTENDSLRRRIKQVEHERDLRARTYEGLAKHGAYYQHYLAQLAAAPNFGDECSPGESIENSPQEFELDGSRDAIEVDLSHQPIMGGSTDADADCDYQHAVAGLFMKSVTGDHEISSSPSSDTGKSMERSWHGKLSCSSSPVLLNACEMYRPSQQPSPMSISDETPSDSNLISAKTPKTKPKALARFPALDCARSMLKSDTKTPGKLIIPCGSNDRQNHDAEARSSKYSQIKNYRARSTDSEDSSSEYDSDDSVGLERRSSDTSASLKSGTNASSVQSRSDSEELTCTQQPGPQQTSSTQSSCSSPTIQAVAARLKNVDVSSSRRSSDCSSLRGAQRNSGTAFERRKTDISSIPNSKVHVARRTESKSPSGSAKASRKNSVQSNAQKRGRQTVHRDEETDSDLKAAIRESYANFKLNGERLKFTYEPQPLDPNAINLNTNWKWRSKLNEATVKKLLTAGGEISAFLPESDDKKALKREVDLIKRLCKCGPAKHSYSSLREIVDALRREREVTRDELNLVEFELYSTLIVMKHQNELEFIDTVKDFSDYQGDLLGMYYSLNMFLSHLDPSWDGLQLLVLVYLLRAGVGRLLKYLVATTRPAAIELLLKRFGESKLMARRRQMIGSLIGLSGETCASRLRQVTPLKRLQDRMASVTAPSVVSAALGYNDPQHIPRESYAGEEFHTLEVTTSNESRMLLPSSFNEAVKDHEGHAFHSNMKPLAPSACSMERSTLRKSICLEEDHTLSPRKRQRGDSVLAFETDADITPDATYAALNELNQSDWLIKDLQMLPSDVLAYGTDFAFPMHPNGQMTGWSKPGSHDDSGYHSTTPPVANQAECCHDPMDSLAELHLATSSGPSSVQVPPICTTSQFRAQEGSLHDARCNSTFSPLTALHPFDMPMTLPNCDESINQDLDWQPWGVSFPSDFFDSALESTVDPRVLDKSV